MDRRTFVTASTAALSVAACRTVGAQFGARASRRVAVIGHTGRGDYGHGLDVVWQQIQGAEIVGVADADPKGLAAAQSRLKTMKGFAEYRDLLDQTRPEFVAICPRHPDQHFAMAKAAIEAGTRGLYIEKPLCRSLAEAYDLRKLCRQSQARVAIAHRNRYHPVLQTIDKLIADGAIGRLLEIRGRGKGDRRGGAEDLWVLGSHTLNLMHYFGGDPRSVSAIMLQDGVPVNRTHVRDGGEALGPLAGNELHARYQLADGVIGYFDSIANDGTRNAGFGLQLIGSEGLIDINCDRHPLAYLVPGNPFRPTDEPRPWTPISTRGVGQQEVRDDLPQAVANHLLPARDLIAAVDEERAPLCDIDQGVALLSMIIGVFESHRRGGERVTIPFEAPERNPLLDL